MIRDLVFLPATAPGETAYGTPPLRIVGWEHLRCHALRFDEMVWYNGPVRALCVEQLRAQKLECPVLVGFSKSGLGAWNLARELGDRVAATVIFDAPMARLEAPPWNTRPYYPDDATWQRDLPLLHVPTMTGRSAPGPLVLVTGQHFHAEMMQVSQRMQEAGIAHHLLPRPQMPHHWQSGWIEQAMEALGQMGVLARSDHSP